MTSPAVLLAVIATRLQGTSALDFGHGRVVVDAKGHAAAEGSVGKRNPAMLHSHALRSPAAGCSSQSSLVHRLRHSRRHASLDNTPLSFMHLGPQAGHMATQQISLALFNLLEHHTESRASLEKDHADFLRPLLPVIGAWREKCADSDGKLLLLLPGTSVSHDASLWETMAAEFSAFLVEKVLRIRPEDVEISRPAEDDDAADGLLSLLPFRSLIRREAPCYSAMAVLRGDAFAKAWRQHFRCNVQDGRLVRHFVNGFMRDHGGASAQTVVSEKAQVCYHRPPLSKDLDTLRQCRLQGKEVDLKVLSHSATAADVARCTVLLHWPRAGATPSGAELWIQPSVILVEVLDKQPSVYSENLALLTGASHFTIRLAQEGDKLLRSASRAIYALNHRAPTDGMSLDEIADASELEGCEEFYHPVDGWTDGWRDVAKNLKSAQT